MKVLLLSEPGSVHTVRWANSLAERGVSIFVYGFGKYNPSQYGQQITVSSANKNSSGFFNKLTYILSIWRIRKIIREIKPDIVHAHYATSYGLLGKLAGFKPFIVSVWGTDVFNFPKTSFLHKYLLSSNLASATKVLSTSSAMAVEAAKYSKKGSSIEITPFGIDLLKFKPRKNPVSDGTVIIGTIKALEEKYGIDILIKAFIIVKNKHPNLDLKLIIVGGGKDELRLRNLAVSLKGETSITFLGRRDHILVPQILQSFDVFAALSRWESFGVSVVEALATGLAVVVSNAGGLPEVVENEISGIVVPKNNVIQSAESLERLILDKQLRIRLGDSGRRRAEMLFDWNKNVTDMIRIYKSVLMNNSRPLNQMK